jgi:hypothetical protein
MIPKLIKGAPGTVLLNDRHRLFLAKNNARLIVGEWKINPEAGQAVGIRRSRAARFRRIARNCWMLWRVSASSTS